MGTIIAWLVLGGAMGWLKDRLGRASNVIGSVLVGMLGALIGGAAFAFMMPRTFGVAHLSPASLAVALFSAGILLFLVSGMSKTLREAMRHDGTTARLREDMWDAE